MPEKIVSSEKNGHGEITVYFGNRNTKNAYYAHSIASLGDEKDHPSRMTTMWAWINHMRSKNWWSGTLEREFIAEVKKWL